MLCLHQRMEGVRIFKQLMGYHLVGKLLLIFMLGNAVDGVSFGWKAIVDLHARKCRRRDSGQARMVPKLREIHILRDSWTKLNVAPAKIMQVCFSINNFSYVSAHLCSKNWC